MKMNPTKNSIKICIVLVARYVSYGEASGSLFLCNKSVFHFTKSTFIPHSLYSC